MQPLSEGPHTTEHPIGNAEAEDDFDKRERRLAAFIKRYRAQAKQFAEAGFKGGLWLDDNGNFYYLLTPLDIDTTFVEISTLVAGLATDPDTPAFSMDGNPIELSKREFAAITMRVPQSGIDWLDAMIREANRRDAATAAFHFLRVGDANHARGMAELAIELADATLAALAKEGAND